jgi:hypothetical protein
MGGVADPGALDRVGAQRYSPRHIGWRERFMAKKAAAKTSVQARRPAAKAPAKKTVKAVAKKAATATKRAAKGVRPAEKKGGDKAPPGRGGRASTSRSGGPVEFIVQVGEGSLTMEYDGTTQCYDIVLFVKNSDQERQARDFVESLGLRDIAIAKAYVKP